MLLPLLLTQLLQRVTFDLELDDPELTHQATLAQAHPRNRKLIMQLLQNLSRLVRLPLYEPLARACLQVSRRAKR